VRSVFLYVCDGVGFLPITKRQARTPIDRLGTRLLIRTTGYGDCAGLEVCPLTTHRERVQELAAEAYSLLTRDRTRNMLLPADGCPAWFTDPCRHAHGGMMPDDWRYEFIQDALGALADGAGEDRLDLDALDPYTADRLDWLTSHLDRSEYCNAAAEEMGGPPAGILAFVAWGMDRELREVSDLVRARLEELAGEPDDADAE
jgi:hypothetical protein